MKTEILLSAYTDKGNDYLPKVRTLIENYTDLKVTILGDVFNKIWAEILLHDPATYQYIALDKNIAKDLNCDYYRISRIFNEIGDVVGRFQHIDFEMNGKPIHIVDTDMVHGETLAIACDKFMTDSYTVPIKVESHQDLIDIEDLLCYNSLLKVGNNIINCSYLHNPKFFSKRTSLPESLYEPFYKLFGR